MKKEKLGIAAKALAQLLSIRILGSEKKTLKQMKEEARKAMGENT